MLLSTRRWSSMRTEATSSGTQTHRRQTRRCSPCARARPTHSAPRAYAAPRLLPRRREEGGGKQMLLSTSRCVIHNLRMMQYTAPQSEVRRTHLSRLSPSARGPREIGSPPHCRVGRGRGCAQEPAEALWRRSHPERHCQRIVYIMPPMPHLCAATHSACRRCRRRARPPLRAQLSSVSLSA